MRGTSAFAASAVPPMSPPPPTGVLITSSAGNLRQQLERGGALPRDDSRVIERMHEFARSAREDFRESFLARRQAGIAQLDARARRFDRGDLRARRIARDDDDGAHATRPCRQRERIAVIARGMRDHERRPRRIELQQHIHRAAILECAAGLQVFALEEHLGVARARRTPPSA